MANRGKPLAWTTREEIQRLRLDGETVRDVARIVGVNKDTASKYSRQVSDKRPTNGNESAKN